MRWEVSTTRKPDATAFDVMSVRNRHWLITCFGLVLAMFVLMLVLGVVGLIAIIGTHNVDSGNRTVSCVTLERVAPDLFAQLPECADAHLPPAKGH